MITCGRLKASAHDHTSGPYLSFTHDTFTELSLLYRVVRNSARRKLSPLTRFVTAVTAFSCIAL